MNTFIIQNFCTHGEDGYIIFLQALVPLCTKLLEDESPEVSCDVFRLLYYTYLIVFKPSVGPPCRLHGVCDNRRSD